MLPTPFSSPMHISAHLGARATPTHCKADKGSEDRSKKWSEAKTLDFASIRLVKFIKNFDIKQIRGWTMHGSSSEVWTPVLKSKSEVSCQWTLCANKKWRFCWNLMGVKSH